MTLTIQDPYKITVHLSARDPGRLIALTQTLQFAKTASQAYLEKAANHKLSLVIECPPSAMRQRYLTGVYKDNRVLWTDTNTRGNQRTSKLAIQNMLDPVTSNDTPLTMWGKDATGQLRYYTTLKTPITSYQIFETKVIARDTDYLLVDNGRKRGDGLFEIGLYAAKHTPDNPPHPDAYYALYIPNVKERDKPDKDVKFSKALSAPWVMGK